MKLKTKKEIVLFLTDIVRDSDERIRIGEEFTAPRLPSIDIPTTPEFDKLMSDVWFKAECDRMFDVVVVNHCGDCDGMFDVVVVNHCGDEIESPRSTIFAAHKDLPVYYVIVSEIALLKWDMLIDQIRNHGQAGHVIDTWSMSHYETHRSKVARALNLHLMDPRLKVDPRIVFHLAWDGSRFYSESVDGHVFYHASEIDRNGNLLKKG